MTLTQYMQNLFFGSNDPITLEVCSTNYAENIYYKTLAIEASVRLISKTLARAEFQTFEKGIETKKTNYYILNVEANKNSSSYSFWMEVISKLLLEGEALIVMQDEQLFLADSFVKKEFAFVENRYEDIVVKGYTLKEGKSESDIIYLKDNNTKVKNAIDSIYGDYSSLIQSSKNGYANSKVRKGLFKIPMGYSKLFKDEEGLSNHIKTLTKDFMNPLTNSILPLTNDAEYDEVAEAKGSKSNDSGRETKNFIDDVFAFVAIAFGIPPSLLKGDTVDMKDAVNNFLAFCINPLSDLIADEVNRKMYGKRAYLENTYSKLDTGSIKSVDLRDIANSLELLTRTGSNTIDDNLRALGREPVGGEIGTMRFVTKNLGTVDSILGEDKGVN